MEKYLQQLVANQQYDKNNFFLIAGPCVVESEELVMEVADNRRPQNRRSCLDDRAHRSVRPGQ